MPIDSAPEMSSAIPPTTTMRLEPMAASPAVRPNGTVKPSERPMMMSLWPVKGRRESGKSASQLLESCLRSDGSAVCRAMPLCSFAADTAANTAWWREWRDPRLDTHRIMSWSMSARSSSPLSVLQQTASGRLCTSHMLFNGGCTVPYPVGLPVVPELAVASGAEEASVQTGLLSVDSRTASDRLGSLTDMAEYVGRCVAEAVGVFATSFEEQEGKQEGQTRPASEFRGCP